MRIGILGAGAVGGTLAALLEQAGHSVAVTARGPHLEQIQLDGLRLEGALGSFHAHPEASLRLESKVDLTFVCTKAQDARTAVLDNVAAVAGSPIVVIQNGLGGVQEIANTIPGADVVGALAVFAASFITPGVVTVTASGELYVGSATGPASSTAHGVAEVLNDAMPTRAIDNFHGATWTKLLINQVNAMPAITGLSAQETLRDEQLAPIITASLQEAARIGLLSGVHFSPLQGLSHGIIMALAAAPVRLARIIPARMADRMGSVPNPGSTLQSIRRGVTTEIDYLNGAVVRAAHDIGRDAPRNRALTDLVHWSSLTGRFVEPEFVAAALRDAVLAPSR